MAPLLAAAVAPLQAGLAQLQAGQAQLQAGQAQLQAGQAQILQRLSEMNARVSNVGPRAQNAASQSVQHARLVALAKELPPAAGAPAGAPAVGDHPPDGTLPRNWEDVENVSGDMVLCVHD